jgi:hypothetical protein
LKLAGAASGSAGLDISATLAADASAIILFAVNDRLEPVTRSLDFSAFGPGGQQAAIWTLRDRDQAGEPDVTNQFGDPERVVPIASRFAAPSPLFSYRFPPLSLTVMEWRVNH